MSSQVLPSKYLKVTWNHHGRRGKMVTLDVLLSEKILQSNGCKVLDHRPMLEKGWLYIELENVAQAEILQTKVHAQMFEELKSLLLFAAFIDPEGAISSASAKAALAGEAGREWSVLDAAVYADQSRQAGAPPSDTRKGILPGIPGLIVIEDFISEEEEAALLAGIESTTWTPQLTRRVQHYGHGFDYRTRTIAGAAADEEAAAAVAAGKIGDRTAPTAIVPPTLPLEAGSPLAQVAAALCRYGFVGDDGHAGWKDVVLGQTLRGRQGLEALGCSTSLKLSSDGAEAVYPSVDQVTVNEYVPGRGIAGHVDTHAGFQDGIGSLSLRADTVMEFTFAAAEREGASSAGGVPAYRSKTHNVCLPRRSLVVLRGEARLAWAHYIPARKTDTIDGRLIARDRRLSATFRCIRRVPCKCAWPSACFDQNGGSSEPAELYSPKLKAQREETSVPTSKPASASSSSAAAAAPGSPGAGAASNATPTAKAGRGTAVDSESAALQSGSASALTPVLETKFVHDLYNTIADHFSDTRHTPWPRVEAYLSALPLGTVVVDIGCGNGKYLAVNRKNIVAVGCDRSSELVRICGERGYQAWVADALAVPVRPGSADVALSIAVLHHVSTRARRVQLIAELLKAVKPGGHVLIYAWAQEQGTDSKRAFSSQDVLVPWCLQRRYLGAGDDAILAAGGVIDDQRGVAVFQRYCHVYVAGELEALSADAATSLGGVYVGERPSSTEASAAVTSTPSTTPVAVGSLVVSGRQGEEGVIATPETVPDAAVAPVRTLDRQGNERLPAPASDPSSSAASPSPPVLDPITLRLQAQARCITDSLGAAQQGAVAPRSDAQPDFTLRLLDKWWEKDNWCVLLHKVGQR